MEQLPLPIGPDGVRSFRFAPCQTSGQQAMQVVAESLAPTAAIMDSMRTDMKQFHTKIHEAISSGLAPSASASMPPTAPKGRQIACHGSSDTWVVKFRSHACCMARIVGTAGLDSGLCCCPAGVVSLAEIEAAQDPTIKLSGLIRQREYEKAFTEALTLSNVNMVTWLCKQLDPKVVLAEPEHGGPLLSQGVQLSLVQQLGSALEMPSDIEVKLDWIQVSCLSSLSLLVQLLVDRIRIPGRPLRCRKHASCWIHTTGCLPLTYEAS